jgi:hypothetical protein
MPPQRRKPRPLLSPAQRREDDHTYRQIEDYYKQRGYAPQNIENLAEDDLQLILALQGRRRTKKPLSLTGMSN